MKYFKYIMFLCCFISFLFAQEDFPISAYQCVDTTWFEGAGEDSLGLNMVHYGHLSPDKDNNLAALKKAHQENLDVVLYYATKGGSGKDDLFWYCCLHWGLWQAEDSSNFFWEYNYWNGIVEPDTFADNDTAFVAYVSSLDACNMLKTRADQIRFYEDSLYLDIIYHLKIDSASLDTLADSVRVCSLYVTKPGGVAQLAVKILTAGDFVSVNLYKACTLTYHWCEGPKPLYYGLYFFDNCDLWCDYLGAKDRWIDSLTAGDYYTTLQQITATYDDSSSLAYYYLLDEPPRSYLAANSYIMDYLNPYLHKPGIQAVSYKEPDWYKTYVDSVDPNVLSIDYYPLRGARYGPDSTPKESGVEFQNRLDSLCIVLEDARFEAKQNGIPFWFICQSFGQYDSITGKTMWCREPTPRELKCMTWLGMAHGAKGINHFLYRVFRQEYKPDSVMHDSGLTANGPPRKPLWTAAKEMNFLMRSIGSTLLSLESDTVFKSTNGIPPDCFIKKVWIWNIPDTLIQIGTFHDNTSDYFIIVNRHCLPEESLEVIVGLEDTLRFLYDCYSKETITYELLIGGPPQPPYYYRIKLQPGQGKLLRVIPFDQEFAINLNQSYANMPYAALITKATSSLEIDSMKIWQNYSDSLVDSTGWIVYDTSYSWFLRQPDTNTIYIKYKIDGSIKSPTYSDAILFDSIAPTGSFVINDDSTFTNTSSITLMISMKDSSSSIPDTSGMSKMRFGNKYLKNIVKNSGFDTTTHWQTDTALYHDSLELYEIPLQTIGNYFYQAIAPESLADFVNDTLLLWIDLVSDGFVGDARVAFQYIYGADTAVRGTYPYGDSITIPEGTNATVSHYDLYSYFKYYPDPPVGERFIEARVGIWIDNDLGNSGKLYIDNFRLDLAGPADDYTRFENHDSLKEWTLITGNGVRKVYGQFSDGAGNETNVSFDSIIVDTTKPARRISYPQNGQTISDTITIMGWAHDSLDDPPHFKQYELQHQSQMSANWYGNDPDSISYTPKYPIQVGQGQKPVALGDWNTTTVNNGWYNLKLTVADLASNSRDTIISVCVNNDDTGEGEFSGFSNYVYGLAAGNQVYIGEFNTGNIYQYNANYELIDTFKLVDSLGTGFPLAMAMDHSGKLWVANSNSHLISKFTSQGSLLLRFAGGFSLPSGFAFDNSGNIWVSDRLHHKIKKFNQDGDSLFAFGTQGTDPGEINRPIGLAYYDDKLYIADSRNKRISVFDTLGNFIEIFADSTTLSMPFSIVIDSAGCLFVSDFVANRVLEYDPFGNPLYQIDTLLDSPTSLALSPDANVLYISDTRNKRVLAFQVRGEPPPGGGPQSYGDAYFDRLMFNVYPSLSAKQMNIRLQGFAGRKISLKVYDVTGRLVKTFYDNQLMKSNQLIMWDGIDDSGRQTPTGIYFIRLEMSDKSITNKVIKLK